MLLSPVGRRLTAGFSSAFMALSQQAGKNIEQRDVP
jgi:hypothetical protein